MYHIQTLIFDWCVQSKATRLPLWLFGLPVNQPGALQRRPQNRIFEKQGRLATTFKKQQDSFTDLRKRQRGRGSCAEYLGMTNVKRGSKRGVLRTDH